MWCGGLLAILVDMCLCDESEMRISFGLLIYPAHFEFVELR